MDRKPVSWRCLLSCYTGRIWEIYVGQYLNTKKAKISFTACILIFTHFAFLPRFETSYWNFEVTRSLKDDFLRARFLSEGGTHCADLRDQELGESLLITCFCITGIYGHTAVYYPAKRIVLVFGGYRFRVHTVSASNELYSLDLATGKWNILQALPSNEVIPAKSWSNLPSAFNSKEKKNYLLCLSMSFFSTISYYFFLKNARWAKIFASGLW